MRHTDLLLELNGFWLLAADEAPQQPADPSGGFLLQFAPILVIIVLMYFMLFRPQKQEQQRHQEMLNSLKKNDRVVTAGGIIGTIASVEQDSREITLKVDQNTRIKFLRSSVKSKLDSQNNEETSS